VPAIAQLFACVVHAVALVLGTHVWHAFAGFTAPCA
jgi:hypothetical protein